MTTPRRPPRNANEGASTRSSQATSQEQGRPQRQALARLATAPLDASAAGLSRSAAVPRDAHGKPAFGPVRRFGDFTLVKKLATGGMAEIWLARQTGLAGFARFLVVKKILAHLAEQDTFVRMFQDEARTSALLSHPNIVQIHDLGHAEGTYYIAMEYIAGENLAAIAWRGMKRGRPLPPAYAANIIADAGKALHYAHNLRGHDGKPLFIVHRDVSPQNILVTYDGEVKVVDFGIAKAATKTEHTKTGMLKGKFSYMSPEQCLGTSVDHRSDVFALGILLYELCTGKRLYKHESELMILDMITKRSVVPPSQVSPHLSPILEDIILRALEKNVRDRFQTAREMQVALEDYLRTDPLPVNDGEISRYMHSLFADKIDEKLRLRQRASRDDFEALFLDSGPSEPTPSGGPRYGPSLGAQPAYAGTRPFDAGTGPVALEAPSFWTRAVKVLAWAVIVVAATILVYHFAPPAVTPTPYNPIGAPAPEGPMMTGGLTIESSPTAATIYLDGEPMRLGDGSPAKSPSDLKGLQYGLRYLVTLKKKGYKSQVLNIEMGAEVDGKTFHPTLEAFPGRLITEVQGAGADAVEVWYDGQPVGSGPRVTREVAGNSTVLVEAKLAGKVCRAEPARVRVLPNRTATTRVRCRKPPSGRPRRDRGALQARRTTPSGAARPAPTGCVTNPDLPAGFVTIATEPFSTVYWGERRLGETPLSSQRLPAGCVELRAVTEEGSSRTVKVEVEPNLTRVYRFKI